MFHTFMTRVVAPLLRALFRPRVEGLENVPSDGPLIVASNHLSFIDSFIIPMCLPRQVTYIAKADYFEGRGIKGRFVRWFLTSLGHVPVQRGAKRAAMGALQQGLEIIEGGGAFAIYPEGTRSPD
ncbi:lysophospholipid acyltransferase family protein, partial [Actinomadura adrarensis]